MVYLLIPTYIYMYRYIKVIHTLFVITIKYLIILIKYLPRQEELTMETKIECEVFSRITGYIRPIRNWNPGKKEEFKERSTF